MAAAPLLGPAMQHGLRTQPRHGWATPAGYHASYPAVFETEFKRPTGLPAKLQCAAAPGTSPLDCVVLTGDGAKDVIVGRLTVK